MAKKKDNWGKVSPNSYSGSGSGEGPKTNIIFTSNPETKSNRSTTYLPSKTYTDRITAIGEGGKIKQGDNYKASKKKKDAYPGITFRNK